MLLRIVSSIVLSAVLFAATTAEGAWNFKMTGNTGEITGTLDVKDAQGQLTGTARLADGGMLRIESGTRTDAKLELHLSGGEPGKTVSYHLQGEVQGDELVGNAVRQGTPEQILKLSATRVKPTN